MRTTVEISDEQHRTLSALAQRRGLRGFSQLVQEALESYLRDLNDDEIDVLLDLEGTLGELEEAELRARMGAARATWRAS
ncbi:MAG: ribbon-helix-helix protein, CopG family [Pseudonocardiaceae bacterium]